MSPRQRRVYGTAATRIPLYARVDPAVKAKVERVADAMGISAAQALEDMLEHVAVDAHGRPEYYDGPLATDTQKELPLNKTA